MENANRAQPKYAGQIQGQRETVNVLCDDGVLHIIPMRVVRNCWFLNTLFTGPFLESRQKGPVRLHAISSKALKVALAFLGNNTEMVAKQVENLKDAGRVYTLADYFFIPGLLSHVYAVAKPVFFHSHRPFVQKTLQEALHPSVEFQRRQFLMPLLVCRALYEQNEKKVLDLLTRVISMKEVMHLIHSPCFASKELWKIGHLLLKSKKFSQKQVNLYINALLKQLQRIDPRKFPLFLNDISLRLAERAETDAEFSGSISSLKCHPDHLDVDTSNERLSAEKNVTSLIVVELKNHFPEMDTASLNNLKYLTLSTKFPQVLAMIDLFVKSRAKKGQINPFFELLANLPSVLCGTFNFFDLTLPQHDAEEETKDFIARAKREEKALTSTEKEEQKETRRIAFDEEKDTTLNLVLACFVDRFAKELWKGGHFDAFFTLFRGLFLHEEYTRTLKHLSNASALLDASLQNWENFEDYLEEIFSSFEGLTSFSEGFLQDLQQVEESPHVDFGAFQRKAVYIFFSKAMETHAYHSKQKHPSFKINAEFRPFIRDQEHSTHHTLVYPARERELIDQITPFLQDGRCQEAHLLFLTLSKKLNFQIFIQRLFTHFIRMNEAERLPPFIFLLSDAEATSLFKHLLLTLIVYNRIQEALTIFHSFADSLISKFEDESQWELFNVNLSAELVHALLDANLLDPSLFINLFANLGVGMERGALRELLVDVESPLLDALPGRLVEMGLVSDGMQMASVQQRPEHCSLALMDMGIETAVKTLIDFPDDDYFRPAMEAFVKDSIEKGSIDIELLGLIFNDEMRRCELEANGASHSSLSLIFVIASALVKWRRAPLAKAHLQNHYSKVQNMAGEFPIQWMLTDHLELIFESKWRLFKEKQMNDAVEFPFSPILPPWSEEFTLDPQMPQPLVWIDALCNCILKKKTRDTEILSFLRAILHPKHIHLVLENLTQKYLEMKKVDMAKEVFLLIENYGLQDLKLLTDLIKEDVLEDVLQ